MQKLKLGILGRGKLVKFRDENEVEHSYYRLNLTNGMSFKSQEPKPAGYDGALVEVYEEGEQPSWADSPLERSAVIFKDFISLQGMVNAKAFDKAVALEADEIEKEVPNDVKDLAN